MPDPKPAKAQRFEVGMRVRVNAWPRGMFQGMKGTVVRVETLPCKMPIGVQMDNVTWDDKPTVTSFSADELEPAPAAQGADPCTE